MYIALKNANDMIRDVVKAMDKNGDEVIEYHGTYREVRNISANQFGCGAIAIPGLNDQRPYVPAI